MDCSISQSLLKLMSIELLMPSNHLIFCHPLFLLPSIFPNIKVFSNKLAPGIRWPKYWSFSFSISFSNEYSGLISFRIGWFDLLAVQGTLKSLLQHRSWKHQFFGTQPSLWSNFDICTWLLDKTVLKIIINIFKNSKNKTYFYKKHLTVELNFLRTFGLLFLCFLFRRGHSHTHAPHTPCSSWTELIMTQCSTFRKQRSWDPTSPFWRRSALGFLWKEWC